MKKSVVENIVAFLSDDTAAVTMSKEEMLDALNEELAKKDALNDSRAKKKKDERGQLVAAVSPILADVLDGTPKTDVELFAMSDKWPEGFTANKLRYMLTNELASMVKRTDNGRKAATYTCL